MILLLAASLLLCWHSVSWIAAAFAGMHDQFNLILLLAIVIIIIKELLENRFSLKEQFAKQINPLAAGLYVFSLLAYYYSRVYIDINLLSAIFLGVLLYSLSGFYLKASSWRQILVPSFLIILTLPFGNLMDTYLGFPLRIAAAELIQQLLQQFGYDSINTETIITLENKSTQINMNCSGMKGFWASWIFYFTLSWIYRLKPNLRWIIVLLFSTLLVLTFNLLRITILVFTELVFENLALSNSIHTPLGLLGFVCSCLITWCLVYYTLRNKHKKEIKGDWLSRKSIQMSQVISRNKSIERLLYSTVLISVFTLLYIQPKAQIRDNHVLIPKLEFPQELTYQEIALTDSERFFFAKDSCYPLKVEFKYKSLEGSLLMVFDGSFRGHHNPEACLQGAGFQLGKASTVLVNKEFPVKNISLNDDSLTATYWFQAPGQQTEDYSSRVWLELLGKQDDWVMISVLFNQNLDAENKDYQSFLKIISEQINNNLINLTQYHETI